jgi:hypothetical protein
LYKTLAPFFHDIWAGAYLAPHVPELKTTDGEDVIPTSIRFDVLDAAALSRALDGHAELERDGDDDGDGWLWSGNNQHGKPTLLGHITRHGDRLELRTQSVERGVRGRALLESAGGDALRHRVTSHENLQRAVQDGLRGRYLRGDHAAERTSSEAELPDGVSEALILAHYATHYRAWVDEPVPALAGMTPRQAAADPKRRAGVIDLVHGLLAIYQGALRQREPAYDPSWMWAELGLVDGEAVRHPPPLAHERVAQQVPGSGELARSVAERLRREPGFDDASTTCSREAEAIDLEIQRYVRADGSAAAPYVRLMVNVELHRRKTFWVDEALAYMLDQTELEVAGRELRVPFAAFGLVFTDRHMLSLAERMLAMQDGCPLAGQLLRIATVYVVEQQRAGARTLEVCFALDALGADLPVLVRHEIPLVDGAPVSAYLDAVAPPLQIDPPPPDTSPIRGLLRTTINAILYATSASVAPERRVAPSPTSRSRPAPPVFSSDEVYFLPGTIDISRVRKLQELERAPDGRALLRRHMVRGHWRRAQPQWADQRLRWIEPYWKGPDMAGIIEHAYRLKP